MFVNSAISASSAFATYAATMPMPIAIAVMTATRRSVVKSPSSCMRAPACLPVGGVLEEHRRPPLRQRHPADEKLEGCGQLCALGPGHGIHRGHEALLGGTGRLDQA